jgi:O-antigen biosynthesis protein
VTGQFPGPRSDAVWRIIAANRTSFDSLAPATGRAERRQQELEAALAQTQDRLRAFETSTIWHLTGPVRWVVEAVKALWSTRATPGQPSVPPSPDPAADRVTSYADWIANEEPAVWAALLRSGEGHAPVATPRLGLVLWTDETGGDPAAKDLAATLAHISPACSVLVLCPDSALGAAREASAAAGRPDASIETGTIYAAALSMALDRLEADYLGFHHLADRMAPRALELVTALLAEQPQTDLLFGDEDWLGAEGQRTRPFFKPGWDPELQRGQDLVGPFAFYRTTRLRDLAGAGLAGPAWRYDLASRFAAALLPERIQHVPAILCHRVAPPPAGHAAAMCRHAEEHLRVQGIAAQAQPMDEQQEWQRIVYAVPQPEPLVSVIIPTRDRPDLLRICTDGVLNRTDYGRIELLIVDNGTEDAEALALMDTLSCDSRVRVLRRPGVFNWSALNNHAASQAEGEILLLLNNDIAVLRPDWMGVMVAHAVQPGVGAVGAKLLYQDGRVQHAGLATDLRGVPRHLFRFAAADDAGPSGLLALARSVWSVTGACLALRRDLLFEVGGLNEGLPVIYNDVDLCLRLTTLGYRTVWTPAALLEHRELASRSPDHVGARREQVREELNRLVRDWGNLVRHDSYLNPNFDLTDETLLFHRSPSVPAR